MPKKKVNNSPFGTTQTEFFRIARQIWNNAHDELEAISARKPAFKQQVIDDALADIARVEQMPQAAARYEMSKVIRDELTRLTSDCLYQWDLLAMYIRGAYPVKTEQQVRLEAAGGTNRKKATQFNWDSVTELMTEGKTFLTNNLDVLAAGNNMPVTFPADYDKAATDYAARLDAYTQEKATQSEATSDRNKAILALFDTLMGLCQDGQAIFAREPEKAKLFTFEDVKNTVLGSKPGGIRGLVLGEFKRPLEGVTVEIVEKAVSTTTNAKGRFEFLQVAAGAYKINFIREFYHPQMNVEHTVETGIVGRMKTVEMDKMFLPFGAGG